MTMPEELTGAGRTDTSAQLWLKKPLSAMRAFSSAVDRRRWPGESRNTLLVTRSMRPAQAEDQPGREVDQPLGVGVVHLGEVHDHRRAVAEVLADRAWPRCRCAGGSW